ncbi:hypothetical protein BSKO_00018 [Bryopsis sp. KO-2023]|nr:hypothetical protein BSKO_00018 [Bryopsis sp. KO-2023]
MTGSKKTPTHEERERAFASIFGTVRADGAGTGMGSTDKDRDEAFGHLTFDKIPDKAPDYKVPEIPKPKVEHASLMDDIHEKPQSSSKPLVMDEKTKNFYALFDHVTPGQETSYGGQAVQPDSQVEFETLPSEAPKNDLPEVKPAVPQRNFLEEDLQNIERGHREEKKPSERYQKAHDAYVSIFGEMTGKE